MGTREVTARGVSEDISTPLLGIRIQQTSHPIFQPLISSIFLSDDLILFKDTGNTTQPTTFRTPGYQPQIIPAAPCLCRIVTTIPFLWGMVNILSFLIICVIIDIGFMGYYLEHQHNFHDVTLRDFILQGTVQRDIIVWAFVNVWVFATRYILLAFYTSFFIFIFLSLARTTSQSRCPLRCGTLACYAAYTFLGENLLMVPCAIEDSLSYLKRFIGLYKSQHQQLQDNENNYGTTRERCRVSLEQGWFVIRLTRYPEYFTLFPSWLCRILNQVYLGYWGYARWLAAFALVTLLQQEGKLGHTSLINTPSYISTLQENEVFRANDEGNNTQGLLDKDKYLFVWIPRPYH
ncbi:hypothetical protein F4782DRAFT_482856 [Xylaria castorea]|nr:hypothetical protein F4782DRAFT_482856 [Xylaria castorea]